VAGEEREGPVADFCVGLGQLQQGSGLKRAALARRMGYSRSQLSEILSGRIRRPPEWDRLVEPLVRVCTGDDQRAVAEWRRRHDVLVAVYSELTRQDRQDRPEGIPRPTVPTRVVPAQLPGDVDLFTGRAQELAELDSLLTAIPTHIEATDAGSTAVVISAVSGTAGVGKTALALRWAHRVRGEFPDGQLYVNLRGYDPDQPLSAADVLARFLRALGVAGADIPLEVEERATTYRSLLDGRRTLIVLDNAATVEQVRPLLPGTPSALVVVTSRDALTGLVVRDGARRLDLDLLPPQDAVALLGALIGERVAAEPDAAATLAGQCARLPLALRIAAELAATRPTISLVRLVEELVDQQRRLELLDAGGDPRTAVRAVFSWSYLHLPADARAFRLLGLHPGPDFDPYATAALTHTNLEQAQHLLNLLSRAHLIQPTSTGRYGMHDLLRAYATHLADIEDPETERRAALTRLFDHYLATAAAAMDTLVPAEAHRRPRISAPATPSPPVAGLAAARAWLDAERATLATVSAHTASHGWPGYAIRLATTLYRYLDIGGHYPDALAIHTHALHAARDAGDRAGEAHVLTNLGAVYGWQGHYGRATDHHLQSLTLFRTSGDQAGEANALDNLGLVYGWLGHYGQAAEHHQQALTLFRTSGDQAGEANALTNLGLVHWTLGHYGQAAEHHQQALTLFREIGHRAGHATALDNLGAVHWRQGRYPQAAEHHQQALTLFRQIGHEAGEAMALNGIGGTHRATGQLREARIQHTAALALATQIGDRYQQARAHDGLAHAHHATGDPGPARHHWHQALALYTDLGVPEADNVHAHLAARDHVTGDDREN